MSRSRPPSPPSQSAAATVDATSNSNIEVVIAPSSPVSSSSTDSASGSASPRGISRRSSTSVPTNTLIVTPLPLPFFEPKILEALKSHFASFSTTFIHRTSPQSPVSAPGPGASIKGTRPMTDAETSRGDNGQTGSGDEQAVDEHSAEGDLYSFVPLKSFKRAIVVFYTPEDAERARIASDRLQIPKTAKSPAVMLRVFRGPPTVLVEDGWFARRDTSGIKDDAEEGSWYFGGFPVLSNTFDDEEIKESPFHLRPPVPERNFLISPPGSPPVGWVATREDPPNESPLAADLVEALERLKAQKAARSRQRRFPGETHRRRASANRSPSLSTDPGSLSHSGTEEEDGVLIIPDTAAGLTVRVEDWGTKRLARLHQAREKGKRHRADSKSEDEPPAKRSKSEEAEDMSEEERQRGALSEMEEELDKELDDGRYSHPIMDWNKFDHARTRVSTSTWKANDGSNMEIEVEMEGDSDDADDDDASNSRFLAQNQMFAAGKSIKVKMPKLGVKPKPASLPPAMPELDLPGQGSPMLGFMPTAMPPLRPTAMPRSSSDGAQ